MPALYFRATRDTKSFFVAQPIFLSIIIIEEVLRVLLSTSLPVLSCETGGQEMFPVYTKSTKIDHL